MAEAGPDANKALSDISARVDAIRNNLPPESQIPVIAIQPADFRLLRPT